MKIAYQAVDADPASPLPVDLSWAMFNEMLSASLPYLLGWKM
jgi:hypothetical protein